MSAMKQLVQRRYEPAWGSCILGAKAALQIREHDLAALPAQVRSRAMYSPSPLPPVERLRERLDAKERLEYGVKQPRVDPGPGVDEVCTWMRSSLVSTRTSARFP